MLIENIFQRLSETFRETAKHLASRPFFITFLKSVLDEDGTCLEADAVFDDKRETPSCLEAVTHTSGELVGCTDRVARGGLCLTIDGKVLA